MTTRIGVATEQPYQVLVGSGALAGLEELAPRFAVSDKNVAPLYGRFAGRVPTRVLGVGEAAKCLAELEATLDAMAEARLDRGSTLAAIGGGVVTDHGGLAAALYMRGIDWVACPTTLLGMVDASVGGKTAVNLSAGKNLAGAFHQPRAVLCDTDTLATLPNAEVRAGLGEVLKTAVIGGGALLEQVLALEAIPSEWADLVAGCVRVKAEIVAGDEHEAGRRAELNLGHTFAHAIEHAAGFGRVPHGIAVAAGIGLALRASEQMGLLEDSRLAERVGSVAKRLGLPVDLADLRETYDLELPAAELLDAMQRDKKRRGAGPTLVLVRRAGSVAVGVTPASGLLEELLMNR